MGSRTQEQNVIARDRNADEDMVIPRTLPLRQCCPSIAASACCCTLSILILCLCCILQVSALRLHRDAQALVALLAAIAAYLPPHAVLPPCICSDVLTMLQLSIQLCSQCTRIVIIRSSSSNFVIIGFPPSRSNLRLHRCGRSTGRRRMRDKRLPLLRVRCVVPSAALGWLGAPPCACKWKNTLPKNCRCRCCNCSNSALVFTLLLLRVYEEEFQMQQNRIKRQRTSRMGHIFRFPRALLPPCCTPPPPTADIYLCLHFWQTNVCPRHVERAQMGETGRGQCTRYARLPNVMLCNEAPVKKCSRSRAMFQNERYA